MKVLCLLNGDLV